MKKTAYVLFSSMFSTVSLFAAYNPSCPGGNCGAQNQQGYQGYDQRYYQGNDQRYYQGNDQRYYQGNQPNYQDQRYYNDPRSQGYYDNRQGDPRYNQPFADESRMQNYGNAPRTQDYNNPNAQKNVSDQDLQKKIQDSLSSWFNDDYQNVKADVNNGFVTLRGTVETIEQKQKAEEKVRKIEGVRQVNNQIMVSGAKTAWNDQYADNTRSAPETAQKYPNDYASTEADRQLNAKIRDKLSSGWFSRGYDTIILRTNNGVVIITGTVDTFDDIKKINDRLKEIEGIKSVSNQAVVKNKTNS